MISSREREYYCNNEPDIFPENWTERSPIDDENQASDVTRRDLEESQGVPYISVPPYDVNGFF